MDSPIFSPFNHYTTAYKTVNSQDIPVHILIPKEIQKGPRPVIIHYHGGFLITGDALFHEWTAAWPLEYQRQHSAIRVSPNYRLLPESNGLEILSDLRDSLAWVESSLASYLKSIGSDVTPDLSKVLVYGDSAGGYLGIHSGLIRPDLVKAVIAAYPMTYLDDDYYTVASNTKSPFGAPQMPISTFDDHIAAMEKGKIVTSALPPARLPLAVATVQHGLYSQLLGTDESLYPAKVVEKMTGKEKVPYLYVLHSREDSAVPVAHTEKFVLLWEKKFGKGSVVAKYESGEHGFDNSPDVNTETPWMKDGLLGVTSTWLG